VTNVVVYTANIGGRDHPHQQADQDIDVDWRYFTDTHDTPIEAPWKILDVARGHGHNIDRHPNLAAKWWKTHPPGTYEHAIWIDASMEITSRSFAREAIAALNGAPVATWRHPRRTSIVDEAEASLGREAQGGRYSSLPLREQTQAYLAEGYPDESLYACGTIVWTWAARPMAHDWWIECVKWGYQDQISFPVCAWRAGITPATFPVPQIESRNPREGWLANRWLRIWPHTKGTD